MVFLTSLAAPAFPAFQCLLPFQRLLPASLFPAPLVLGRMGSPHGFGDGSPLHLQVLVSAQEGVVFSLQCKSSI